jgi:16S rRNA processing protein RimM
MNNLLTIATIGRVVGLKGEVKLHLHTDFDSQFKRGATFTTSKNRKLIIEKFDKNKSIVKFLGISTREDAQKLTNQTISTTIKESRKSCELNDDEYFWFDIIGCKVVDDGKTLGIVKDIQRLTANDYLEVKTSKEFDNHTKHRFAYYYATSL